MGIKNETIGGSQDSGAPLNQVQRFAPSTAKWSWILPSMETRTNSDCSCQVAKQTFNLVGVRIMRGHGTRGANCV